MGEELGNTKNQSQRGTLERLSGNSGEKERRMERVETGRTNSRTMGWYREWLEESGNEVENGWHDATVVL